MRPSPFRPHHRTRWLALVVPLLAGAVPAVGSAAGTYEVWSCRAPDGSPAIVRDDGGGWVAEISGPLAGNLLSNTCADAGHFGAAHATEGAHPAGSQSAWRFDAPPDLSISQYALDVSGWARGTRTWAGETRGLLGIFDDTQLAPTIWTLNREGDSDDVLMDRNLVTASADGAVALQVLARCVGESFEFCAPDPGTGIASFKVFRTTVTLRDAEAPVVTDVQGDGVNAGVWPRSGVGMTVAATDRGGGVLRVGVEIDGGEPQWHAVAGAPCRIWPGTERAFVAPTPCPAASSTPLTIPTAALAAGVHSVRVLVEDAAGNQTTAYGPISKRISDAVGPGGDAVGDDPAAAPSDPAGATPPAVLPGADLLGRAAAASDPGPLNGAPASASVRLGVRWEGTASTVRKVRYGRRPVLRGQLTTTDGRPIRDAAIRVGVVQEHRSAQRVEHQALRTDAGGGFRWRMPKGIGSRRITLAYYEHVAGTAPAASVTLRLRVAAAVRMTLDRRTARQGQTVRLRGRLVGRPLPKVGSVVELQARNPGRKWITFRTVRANRSGRFAAGYRFRMPGPAVFEMRARVRRSGDYPYDTGVSPHRRIRVR
jgi:hypothetical protein